MKKQNNKKVKKKKVGSREIIISPRIAKIKKSSLDDPIVKTIMKYFDDGLREDFMKFLQERELAKIIPITKGKKKIPKGEYKKQGLEVNSFRELTSHRHPSFSLPGPYSPDEYNPETIDIDTFNLMRRDSQLAVGLSFIKLPIISLSWVIECDDNKIAKTVEWALKKVWRDLIKSSLLALDYGFATHEKVWKREKVKISEIDKTGKEEVFHNGDLVFYKKIKPNHPGSIKMKFDNKQNLIEIIQEGQYMTGDIRLPIRKCFLFTNEKEFGNPFGTSRLKNAYEVWYWKKVLYQFMMQYFERRGTPPTIATAPPGKSRDSSGTEIENLELALRLGSSLVSNSIAVLPYQPNREGRENMWKLELLNDDARGPMFVEALAHLDSRCLRAIFVPEGIVGQESGSGGRGGSSVHADLFLISEKGLISDIEEAVDEQIIRPFIEANYSPDKQKPCHVKLEPLDWNRKIALKEIFVELLRNADTLIQQGAPPKIMPSLEKVAEILNIPVGTFEEVTGFKPEEITKMVKEQSMQKRQDTRATDTNQTSDRRKVNPGSRRADRARKSDSTKKSD